ncbi:uncharacterized protein PRCAT00004686001 [Priceomyces carsonii]|uniref:uncharacterized protein n=1 Tax=Priceomyces carsonii TaxID=28549 RepID=UPI002ED94CD3|nr:unnamed protein product [Priceomyces carsonii]
MEESIFYISEGDPNDKHSKGSFGMSASLPNSQIHATFRNADCSQNGAALTGVGLGERLFVASPNKALINVYSWGKESPDQRIPVPEQLDALALCHQPTSGLHHSNRSVPRYRIPWLLAGGAKSGKLYIWELASGNLLCVKEAHYQGISVLKFSECGTFLATGGLDARCMIWRVLDLVSIYGSTDTTVSSKPFALFNDHTLPIADLLFSDSGIINDLRLYTASNDGTLRIYDIMSKNILTTFILPDCINCIAKDPANRALYVGLLNGTIRMIPLYQINPNTSVLESIGGNSKIVTLDNDTELKNSFTHHQQADNSSTSSTNKQIAPTKITISLDGTNMISGDTAGRVIASDIVTKQVIKSFEPCTAPISQLIAYVCPSETVAAANGVTDKRHRLIPQFKRILVDPEPSDHFLYMELPKNEDNNEFEDWILKLTKEELEFKNLSTIDSSVKVMADNNAEDTPQLEEKMKKLSKAYTDLRVKHQELYEEHKKLLSTL